MTDDTDKVDTSVTQEQVEKALLSPTIHARVLFSTGLDTLKDRLSRVSDYKVRANIETNYNRMKGLYEALLWLSRVYDIPKDLLEHLGREEDWFGWYDDH